MNATATRHEIWIPGWRPASINEFRDNRWKRAELKARDRKYVKFHSLAARVPVARGRRRVSLRITLPPRGREVDPDNLTKSLLDALVHAGLLVDDRGRFVEWGGVSYERSTCLSTTIILEELERKI